MAQPIDVSMPQDLQLGQGYTLRVTTLDANTGNLVSGANVGQVVITATNLAGGVLDSGTFSVLDPILLGTLA